MEAYIKHKNNNKNDNKMSKIKKEILTLSECCNEELTKDFKCRYCGQDCETYEEEAEPYN